MNRLISLLGVFLIAALTACGEKAPNQAAAPSKSASPPPSAAAQKAPTPQPMAAAPTKKAASDGVGPGDLRLGMSAADMLQTSFLRAATDKQEVSEQEARSNGLIGRLTLPGWTFSRDLIGQEGIVEVGMTDGRVAKIQLHAGHYTQQRLSDIFDSLRKSYTLTNPTQDEMDDFNAKRKSCIAWVDDSNTVALKVSRGVYSLAGATTDLFIIYQKPDEMDSLIKYCGPHALLKGADTKL